MKKYWVLCVSLLLLFAFLFFGVESFEIQILNSTDIWLESNRFITVVIGIGALAADIFLPIPIHSVMKSNGLMFGILLGAFISAFGRLISTMIGFYMGALLEPQVNRWIGNEEQNRFSNLFKRYGDFIIVATRPIPILSEVVSILSGISNVGHTQMIFSSLIGIFPETLFFAFKGVYDLQFQYELGIICVVTLIGFLAWKTSKKFFVSKISV